MGTTLRQNGARQRADYLPVGQSAFVVPARSLNAFARDYAQGLITGFDQDLGDIRPRDPRGFGFKGGLPRAARSISASQLEQLLRENGLFGRIVDTIAEDTWGEGWTPRVEGDEKWAKEAEELVDTLDLRRFIEMADKPHIAAGLSLLYFNLDDATGDPAKEPTGGVDVAKIQVVPRSSISGANLDEDKESPRWGEVDTWKVRLRQGAAQDVHWSRVIPLRETPRLGHAWDGVGLGHRVVEPVMMAGNIAWAVGETYLQRAAPLLIVKIREGFKPTPTQIDDIAKDVGDLQNFNIQKLIAKNFDVVPLGESVRLPDPKPFYEIALTEAGIASGIPQHRLRGSAPGELSSSQEDSRRHNARISRREENWAASLLRELYARFSLWGLLREANRRVRIEWKPLGEPTAKEVMEIEQGRSMALQFYELSRRDPPAKLVDYEPASFPSTSETPPEPVRVKRPEGDEGPEGEAPAMEHAHGQADPVPKVEAPELRLVTLQFQTRLQQTFLKQLADLRSRVARARKKTQEQPAEERFQRRDQLDPSDPAVRILLNVEIQDAEIIRAIEQALLDAAQSGGQRTFAELGQEPIRGFLDESTIRVFKTVARTVGAKVATRITDEIRADLSAGLMRGETLDQLTDRVLGTFDRVVRYEAERIARTESMNAYTRGSLEGMRAAGIKQFRVLVFEGACKICAPLSGQVFDVDDAAHTPTFHANCNCVPVPVVPGVAA